MKMLTPLRLCLLSLFTTLVVVLISFSHKHPTEVTKGKRSIVLDEAMTSVKAKRFNAGSLSQVLVLTTWIKNKEENIIHFKNPVLTTLQENGCQWQISANSGQGFQINSGQFDKFELQQNVVISSFNKEKQQEWHLLTDFLDYYPTKKTASTSHEVRIEGPEILMKAKGMSADLNQHTVKFIEKVNAYYAAKI